MRSAEKEHPMSTLAKEREREFSPASLEAFVASIVAFGMLEEEDSESSSEILDEKLH